MLAAVPTPSRRPATVRTVAPPPAAAATARSAWLRESTTKTSPLAPSTATPTSAVLNAAASPWPSAKATGASAKLRAPEPASVVTAPDATSSARSTALPASAISSVVPAASKQRPDGDEKKASAAGPSTYAGALPPPPAAVRTAPDVTSTLRMALFAASASQSVPSDARMATPAGPPAPKRAAVPMASTQPLAVPPPPPANVDVMPELKSTRRSSALRASHTQSDARAASTARASGP